MMAETLDADETQLLLHAMRAVAERQLVQTRVLELMQDQLDNLNTYQPRNDDLAHAVRQYLDAIRVPSRGGLDDG